MKENRSDFKNVPGSNEFVLPYDRLMTLFHISHRINQISDIQKLLDEILHSAITNLGAERGMIILTDESGESYHTVASDSLQKEDIAFSKSIVRTTLESNKTLLNYDVSSDSHFKDATSVKKLHILSFICVPLSRPGQHKALGTLYIDQRISVKVFTPEDAAFLEAFANLAAIAINNTRFVEQLLDENVQLRREVVKKFEFPGVIGQSKVMHRVFRAMKQILNDDCTVLLTGESGSGKEVIAKAIHYNGNRKDKSFLAVNCGALPETILEAELFGSVRGAFTGALDKQGLFQAAHGGTLFLDEIHHTSEGIQVKLLRVLQDKEIRKVGGTKTTKVNVRLICATNEDLEEAVEAGHFRQDFFYRINVVTIRVPALREHRKDIPILAKHFLEKYCREKNKRCRGFDRKTLDALIQYDWDKNNIRELENEIERLVIFIKDGAEIKLRDLSEKIRYCISVTKDVTGDFVTGEAGRPLSHEQFERKYIRFILSQVGGNQNKAAKIMGIPRTTLRSKMKKLGLSK